MALTESGILEKYPCMSCFHSFGVQCKPNPIKRIRKAYLYSTKQVERIFQSTLPFAMPSKLRKIWENI